MMFFGVFITTDDMCLVQTALPAPRPMNERRAACQLQSHSCSFREHRKCGAGYNFALDAEGPYMCYLAPSLKSVILTRETSVADPKDREILSPIRRWALLLILFY
jgi:hypothetical protein